MLSKDLPVVDRPQRPRWRSMGFTAVKALNPGECTQQGPVQIRATAGAVPAGNGYLLTGLVDRFTEPRSADPNVEERPCSQ